MTIVTELGHRPSLTAMIALEERFEVIKEIGDGSFGSVAVARVRAAGSNVARRGTMVSLELQRVVHVLTCPGGYQDDEENLRFLHTLS